MSPVEAIILTFAACVTVCNAIKLGVIEREVKRAHYRLDKLPVKLTARRVDDVSPYGTGSGKLVRGDFAPLDDDAKRKLIAERWPTYTADHQRTLRRAYGDLCPPE